KDPHISQLVERRGETGILSGQRRDARGKAHQTGQRVAAREPQWGRGGQVWSRLGLAAAANLGGGSYGPQSQLQCADSDRLPDGWQQQTVARRRRQLTCANSAGVEFKLELAEQAPGRCSCRAALEE